MTEGIIKQEARFITIAETVQEALRTRDPEKLTVTYQALDEMLFKLGSYRDLMKAALKEVVIAQGTDTSGKGSKELVVGGFRVPLKAMNSAGALDDAKVEGKLRAKGVDLINGMTATVTWRAQKDKLEKLKAAGKWTEQDSKDCEVPRKWALYPPEKVKTDE